MLVRSASVGVIAAACALLAVVVARPAEAQSLGGSAASLDRQNRVARQHDYSFLQTGSQVRRFVSAGYLVPIVPSSDFEMHLVSFPYARPEVQLFLDRLASQYRRACGERLVVTSLTRPESDQPRNASDRSVHPTGMAIDLRLSRSRTCRSWLERVLLDLERGQVLEATRERRPAHYHIALFPRSYTSYLENRGIPFRLASASTATPREPVRYRVRSGDSLWTIARKHGTTVAMLQNRNALTSSRIVPGQVLELPVAN
jgi:hypothetical protein